MVPFMEVKPRCSSPPGGAEDGVGAVDVDLVIDLQTSHHHALWVCTRECPASDRGLRTCEL